MVFFIFSFFQLEIIETDAKLGKSFTANATQKSIFGLGQSQLLSRVRNTWIDSEIVN
jgi:hypothetical protein